MGKILTSLHGQLTGLDVKGNVIAKGFGAGTGNNQRLLGSPTTVEIFDDFLGDILNANWNVSVGADTLPPTAVVLANGIGGQLRFTTGNDGTGLAADSVQLTSFLNWQASNGDLVFETRAKLSAITTCWAFLGFTDLSATLEAPIISAGSADTITTTATDAVGFMFDTRMATDTWWLVGVATDQDATSQNTGFAPVADTFATFRIEVSTTGVARFFYNGLQVGVTMAGALTPGADLTPIITASKTSVTASMTVEIDYVHVSMTR